MNHGYLATRKKAASAMGTAYGIVSPGRAGEPAYRPGSGLCIAARAKAPPFLRIHEFVIHRWYRETAAVQFFR